MDVLISAPQKAPCTLYTIRYTLYSTYTQYPIRYTLYPTILKCTMATLAVAWACHRLACHPTHTHACSTRLQHVEHTPAQHTHTSPAARHRAGRARRVPAS